MVNSPADPGKPLRNSVDDAELKALTDVVAVLRDLAPEARGRVVSSAVTFLEIELRGAPFDARQNATAQQGLTIPFSQDRTSSPKEFLFEKRPATDVDRIAALAYYLTHYRATPHFKTLDLSKLNTEAAQLKFSNAAVAVDNASKTGLLVPASKGAKQLSALGELYVQALPDRDAARKAIAHARPKRKNRRDGRANTRRDDDGAE